MKISKYCQLFFSHVEKDKCIYIEIVRIERIRQQSIFDFQKLMKSFQEVKSETENWGDEMRTRGPTEKTP